MDLDNFDEKVYYPPGASYKYRLWCKHLRSIGHDPRKRGFARNQWKQYWAGERGHLLCDAAIYLIDKYGYRCEKMWEDGIKIFSGGVAV